MVYLYNQSTGEMIGEITEGQLQYLIDQMEEETPEDQDYSITRMELDYFEGRGADPGLLSLLNKAIGDEGEVIIQWTRSIRSK
jgi:processive 1,2-diacylglycerol beta-glucosyltransferase